MENKVPNPVELAKGMMVVSLSVGKFIMNELTVGGWSNLAGQAETPPASITYHTTSPEDIVQADE